MSGATDKRFRSFLWSQTRKAAYAETRLTVPEEAARGTQPLAPAEAPPSPATAAGGPAGRAKGRLTPLEQAAMRMSEFCAPPTDAAVPTRAPGALPPVTGEAPPPDWHQLHVHRPGETEAAGTTTPLGRLNVRKAH